MIDYSSLNGKIYAYDRMHSEMTQGLPEDLASHILSEAGSIEIGGKKYVNRNNVDRYAEKILGISEINADESTPADTEQGVKDSEELREKLSRLQEDLSASAKEHEKEINALKNALDESHQQIEYAEELLKQSEERCSVAEKECEKEKQERIQACIKLQETEERIKTDSHNYQKEVNNLKGRITDLNRKLAAKADPDDDGMVSSSSKAGMKKEIRELTKKNGELASRLAEEAEKTRRMQKENEELRENLNSKTITELELRNTALEKLLEKRNGQAEKLEDDLKNSDARNSKLREDLRAANEENERLRQALDKVKAKSSDSGQSDILSAIPQYYRGEILDFIGFLARQRLSALPDEDASTYRRERDLCEELSKAFPDSGMQKSLRRDIDNAVRMKHEKNSDIGLLSLGLSRDSSNSHEKYVLGDEWGSLAGRFSFVLAKTPSDCRAWKEAAACLSRMLSFGSVSSQEEEAND